MDRVCVRCTYLSLRTQHALKSTARTPAWRTFTTSVQQRADDSSRETQTPPLRIIRQPQDSPKDSSTATNSPPRSGLLIRRTSDTSNPRPRASEGSSPGGILRRTRPPGQTGQLLRRTGAPRRDGSPGGRPGGATDNRGGQRLRKRVTESQKKAREAEEDDAPEELMNEYLEKYIDRNPNPTTRQDYNPKPQEMDELEKDWPNTPLSNTGLSASVTQKIEWLARRLPHGYQTPQQLAEHFQKGNLTRFESEEEKQEVLKIAAELAQARAQLLSERKGSEVAAEDMGLADIGSRDEKKMLMDQVVKGEVKELERQRMPFLESVTRNLRNNGTYKQPDMDQFMSTVQRLMPAQTQRRAPARSGN